jgi:POT family proton-dependent oligopeptide transporter
MPSNIDNVAIGATHDIALALSPDEKHQCPASGHTTEMPPVFPGEVQPTVYRHDDFSDEDIHGELPTEEELHTLRRVADKIPWRVYTIAFVELCERFSYYGTTVVCMFMNFSRLLPHPLTSSSHQLHPTAAPRWFAHWCWIRRAIRRS